MIGLIVEGLTDRAAGERLLAVHDLTVDERRVIVTGGKRRFDSRIRAYNGAARHGAWLALRDLDREEGRCPVALRARPLPPPSQAAALSLRIVVSSLDAWLLADREAFAYHFSVSEGKIPSVPEELTHPKDALTKCCKSSRSRAVRMGMVPPSSATGAGPEYTDMVSSYCREAWRPDVAASAAPSLRRALAEIGRLRESGVW